MCGGEKKLILHYNSAEHSLYYVAVAGKRNR